MIDLIFANILSYSSPYPSIQKCLNRLCQHHRTNLIFFLLFKLLFQLPNNKNTINHKNHNPTNTTKGKLQS